MRTTITSTTDSTGSLVARMLLFLATLAAMAGAGLLFSSLIDLVQTWAVLHQWSAALVD